MAQTALANIGINYNWTLGSDGWKAGMDTNLILIDALMQGRVVAVGTDAAPGSPSEGDAYIVGDSPSGEFSGNAGKFAVFNASAWTFVTPRSGWSVYDTTNAKLWIFNGTDWTDNLLASVARGVRALTTDAHTLELIDAWQMLELTDGSGVALTVPDNDTVSLPVGVEIEIAQAGAGAITFSAPGDAVIQSVGSADETSGQHAIARLKQVATDVWRLSGDIT